jgi:hypothetical protein
MGTELYPTTHLAGRTNSPNFPLSNAFQPSYGGGLSDAFITKFNPSGPPIAYSTYLGGSGAEVVNDIAVDANGSLHMAGTTSSLNFPTVNAYQPANAGLNDAFMTKLNAAGTSAIYSTYLGGSNNDEGHSVAVDPSGKAYIVGWTQSTNFPTSNAIQFFLRGDKDAFASKFNDNGASLLYSTYLGGSAEDQGLGVAVATVEPGIAFVTGYTQSTDFPTAAPYQPNNAGNNDAFVSKINDQCGPSASYIISQSNGAAIVPGTTNIGSHCDDCVRGVTLPFPFQLYGQGYTNISVSSNGNLQFISGSTEPWGQCTPYYPLRISIMPHWTNLRTDCANCGVFTSISGNAPNRIFNIEWRAGLVSGGGPVNFEVRLYEAESRFDFIYGIVTNSGSTAVVGVQRLFGGIYYGQHTEYSCYQPVLNPGLQVTFTQPSCNAGTPTVVPTNTATTTSTSTLAPTRTVHTVVPTNTPMITAISTPTAAATSCPITFTDVPNTHTFYANVRCLACRGIISGYADGTFKPDNLVTRGQLAKIVSNAANFTESPGAQIFQDVAPDHPFYEWINRLTNRGYMSGYTCGSPGEPCVNNRPYFRPFANATRGQTSKIVANAAMIETNIPPTQQSFEDVPPTQTFWLWIERLAARGVMGGYQCGGPGEPCILPANRAYFRPNNNVTRGQSAKIVSNTFFPDCRALQR